MRRTAKHIHRELTPAERALVAGARENVAMEKDEIRRRAKELKAECDAESASLERPCNFSSKNACAKD